MMETKFLFNYAPPALLNMPAAAFSVLKSYMEAHGVGCKIYYWNFKLAKLQMDFLWQNNSGVLDDETSNLLLFFNYLSVRMNDNPTYNKIKGHLMGMKPQFIGRGEMLFDNHMKHYADMLEEVIDQTIDEIYNPNIKYYGFSANLYQWLSSSIIAARLKQKHPESIVILGGMGTKNAAVKYLEMFRQFDFALWGEGENSLHSLVKQIETGNIHFELISNLAYRREAEVIVSENRKVIFADLACADTHPDYSEYFLQKEEYVGLINPDSCYITLEGSRGCHWNKCHFCYLNTGYRNRYKSVEVLIEEIESNIKKYDIYLFGFLDNDVINNDFKRFEELLNQLFLLKQKYPEFRIRMTEIITKNINADYVKRMALAGFEYVQIGYESSSNKLLHKIDKKNTFASNLLFIKFALQYKIQVGGANIIQGLLEETDEDIIEAINNLYPLRFYSNYIYFKHNMSGLAVSRASRYYKKIETYKNWNRLYFFENYLPNIFLECDKELDIMDIVRNKFNPIWNNFSQVENFYLKNSYTYQLIRLNDMIIYKEYYNYASINELEFDSNSLDWYVLEKANSKILTFEELNVGIKEDFETNFMTVEIINLIEDLKAEGLIYVSEDYSEIISIINTSIVT